MPSDSPERVSSDLVEYLIVAVPAVDSLALLASALAELVQRAAIRILDVVVLTKDVDGAVTALELDAADSMAAIRNLEGDVGRMLSDRDLALASTALRPGWSGVILVTEDCWAEPLSVAAQRAGGQIVAGERIPAWRVETALADRVDENQTGA